MGSSSSYKRIKALSVNDSSIHGAFVCVCVSSNCSERGVFVYVLHAENLMRVAI